MTGLGNGSTQSVDLPGKLSMPRFGLGTYKLTDKSIVEGALALGYRLLDTAHIYQNQDILGQVIKDGIQAGKYKRDELFITTKLPGTFMTSKDLVRKSLLHCLSELKLSYVDLFLVHSPCAFQYRDSDEIYPTDANGIKLYVDHDLVDTWKSMECMVEEGLTRTIGVSNFNINQLKKVVEAARIPVANHQYECHLLLQDRDMLDYCTAHDITVTAYAPLGNPGRVHRKPGTGPNILELPLVLELSSKYKRSPAQVLLGFLLQQGIFVIPKSQKLERVQENIQSLSLELSLDDMARLRKEDKNHRYFSYGDIYGGHPQHPFEVKK